MTGADAEITAKLEPEQAITRLDVKAVNLAPPGRVLSGTTHYVVWERGGSGDTWRRVGALDYDEGSRTGSLNGVTVPQLDFELQITPEDRVAPNAPSGAPVFTQMVSKDAARP
ncbi:MAG TPA: hypothetical protein VEY30_13965 [Myxococcaceae bacterium]|nr:hypothetical protein [Myxococcaceae bacterium]